MVTAPARRRKPGSERQWRVRARMSALRNSISAQPASDAAPWKCCYAAHRRVDRDVEFGAAKLGVFGRLNASHRNCSLRVSEIWNCLNSEKSTVRTISGDRIRKPGIAVGEVRRRDERGGVEPAFQRRIVAACRRRSDSAAGRRHRCSPRRATWSRCTARRCGRSECPATAIRRCNASVKPVRAG